MTNRSAVEGELVQLMAGIVNVAPERLQRDAGLADAGMSSLELVEAIFVIEDRYGISIPYNANDPAAGAAFQTVGGILDVVVDLILAKQAGAAVRAEVA